MSLGSNVQSKDKSTVPADVIVSNTVRKIREAIFRDFFNIDKAACRRKKIAIAAYYRAEKYRVKNGGEEQDWLEAEVVVEYTS